MARESNSGAGHLKEEAKSFYNGYKVGGYLFGDDFARKK